MSLYRTSVGDEAQGKSATGIYICRLMKNYGFTVKQMAQEVLVSNSQRGQERDMADIVLSRNAKDKSEHSSLIIVIECKTEHIYNYLDELGQQ